MNPLICQAIAKRAIIEFYYNGGIRIAEPHCHGTSTSNDEVLLAFQIAGFSTSGNPVDWKLFEVSKMSHLMDNGNRFAKARASFDPKDKKITTIHCHI